MIPHGILSFRGRLPLAVVIIATAAAPLLAQQPAPSGPSTVSPRRGGLLPQRAEPGGSTLITREELIRKFDLDGNGRIDEAEAEMARSRMRRERADLRPQSMIDPLTGRPRGAKPPEPPAIGKKNKSDADRDEGDELLLVPGRPDDKPPAEAKTETAPPSKSAAGPPKPRDLNAAFRNPTTGERVAPNALRPPVVTGGVRAGGLPVRPGYGSTLPKTDLNTARRPVGAPPAAPAIQGSRPVAPQRPTLFPQSGPRVSAEEMGR
jgi:hypothetical protein